jgi:hypothetical protein
MRDSQGWLATSLFSSGARNDYLNVFDNIFLKPLYRDVRRFSATLNDQPTFLPQHI